eukprot:2318082-Pyramimonas_sp.AAC.1
MLQRPPGAAPGVARGRSERGGEAESAVCGVFKDNSEIAPGGRQAPRRAWPANAAHDPAPPSRR